MNFQDFLLQTYPDHQKNKGDIFVSSVCSHSSQVKKNSLFIALKGQNTDGHNYLKSAIEKGATALLIQKNYPIPQHFRGWVLFYDEELFLDKLLNFFYDYPSEKLFTVGITGTNGKSSFCYLLRHLFETCGWPTAVIGTLGYEFKNTISPALLTTPYQCELFEKLAHFTKLSARALAMEVSSIAIDQDRVAGVDFNALVFSNLSQDHLDYHKNIESYFLAKKKLFIQADESSQKNLFHLLNEDDIYSHKIKKHLQKPFWTFGKSPQADFCFQIKKMTKEETFFELQSPSEKTEFRSPLKGEYNVYNAVSAIACAYLTGFKMGELQKALLSFKGVPGRLEKLAHKGDFEVFIDYAHTPQALLLTLQTLKQEFSFLILVFGCGGDRDKEKRQPMMRVALQLADSIFLTTDNPRDEDPEKINQDMLKGQDSTTRVLVELDRSKAIKKAIRLAHEKSKPITKKRATNKQPSQVCVLIAGKGHESYQIIKGERLAFSDKKTALEWLDS